MDEHQRAEELVIAWVHAGLPLDLESYGPLMREAVIDWLEHGKGHPHQLVALALLEGERTGHPLI